MTNQAKHCAHGKYNGTMEAFFITADTLEELKTKVHGTAQSVAYVHYGRLEAE